MAAFPVLVTLEMLSGAQIGSTPGVHPGEAAFAGFLVEVAQVQDILLRRSRRHGAGGANLDLVAAFWHLTRKLGINF